MSNNLNIKSSVALVTGATGFIGSHLVKQLIENGWQVNILIRKESASRIDKHFSNVVIHEIINGSTEEIIGYLNCIKPDVVFHLAGFFISEHHMKSINSLINSNILLGNQLLEGMKLVGKGLMVNTGTSWQHFKNESYNPVCLYAATKQAFESIIEFYVRAYGFNVITLKLFDTYGPKDYRGKLFSVLKDADSDGKSLDMTYGEQFIDLVHVNDVIDAYIIAADKLLSGHAHGHESYSVSSGAPIQLRKLVELYQKISKRKINIFWGGIPYRQREVMQPWNQGVSIDGWIPKINLFDGITSIVNTETTINYPKFK